MVAEEAPRFMILGTVKAEDEPTMTTITRRAMAAERTMINGLTYLLRRYVREVFEARGMNGHDCSVVELQSSEVARHLPNKCINR